MLCSVTSLDRLGGLADDRYQGLASSHDVGDLVLGQLVNHIPLGLESLL